jgi:hypothetical protein
MDVSEACYTQPVEPLPSCFAIYQQRLNHYGTETVPSYIIVTLAAFRPRDHVISNAQMFTTKL